MISKRGKGSLPASRRGGIYVYRKEVLRRGVWLWQEWVEVKMQFFRKKARVRSFSFKKYGEAAAMRAARRVLKEWRSELFSLRGY